MATLLNLFLAPEKINCDYYNFWLKEETASSLSKRIYVNRGVAVESNLGCFFTSFSYQS